MDARQFLSASRVLIVAGKGGVGKSTLAGAVALAAARQGLATRLVTLDGTPAPVPDHDLLVGEQVSPGRALSDYLEGRGLGFVTRRLARTGIVELVASTAPGIDDLLVLGKIKSLAREGGLVVVDGPASGHALDLLRAPAQLRRAVPGGPIGQQADEVLAMLADPAMCRTLLVTTPALTPVHETLESARGLVAQFGLALAPVVVNMVDEAPPPLSDPASLAPHLRNAHAYATERALAQAEAVTELDSGLARASLRPDRLLLRRHRLAGVDLVDALATDLTEAVGALPVHDGGNS